MASRQSRISAILCRSRLTVWGVVLLTITSACNLTTESARPTRIDLSREWVAADPALEGVDGARLARAASDARQIPGLRSLLVVRHGALVGEYYFGNARADTLFEIRSITKGVTSLLVGVAFADRRLAGPAEVLSAALPSRSAILTPAEGRITLGSLLSMSSGFQWFENGGFGYNDWISAPDQIAYVLARPVIAPPGQTFAYNSAGAHLVSVAVSDAYGRSLDQVASERLFAPLGVRDHLWEVVSQGYNNGAAGLAIRARDLAKIGQLVLQDGISGARVVVPSSWIAEATQPHIDPSYFLGSLGNVRYGYFWWLGTVGGHAIVMGWGYAGQYLIVVRDLDLVLVSTAEWQLNTPDAALQASAIREYLLSEVLAAIGS